MLRFNENLARKGSSEIENIKKQQLFPRSKPNLNELS